MRSCHPEQAEGLDSSRVIMRGTYCVYVLKCRDNTFYTGITKNIDRRMWEHESGWNVKCYTFNRRPVRLSYIETYVQVVDAIAREKQIKGWSRKKKEALIEDNEDALFYYSNRKRWGVDSSAYSE